MPVGRSYDDLVTKAIEFNLAIVNQVYLNELEPSQEENENSQIVEIKPLNTVLPTVQKRLKARKCVQKSIKKPSFEKRSFKLSKLR